MSIPGPVDLLPGGSSMCRSPKEDTAPIVSRVRSSGPGSYAGAGRDGELSLRPAISPVSSSSMVLRYRATQVR